MQAADGPLEGALAVQFIVDANNWRGGAWPVHVMCIERALPAVVVSVLITAAMHVPAVLRKRQHHSLNWLPPFGGADAMVRLFY